MGSAPCAGGLTISKLSGSRSMSVPGERDRYRMSSRSGRSARYACQPRNVSETIPKPGTFCVNVLPLHVMSHVVEKFQVS